MTEFLFPDNTVLCNFAAVNRLDLLKAVLDGRGRWTEAVAYEATQSARVHPDLGGLATDQWLGEPIEIGDDSEIQQINAIRRAVFGGTDNEPLKHLGEAQTCFVILKWSEFAGSWWISDDREALRYARLQGITTRETIDLVSTAVVYGHIRAHEGFGLMQQMATQGRHLRLPGSAADLQR
jgi:predicted nucleic acid-binding protein